MRVLITGGAGFLGSHLCDRFIRDGHSVVCLDSFVTGRRDNIAALAGHERFELIEGDVAEVDLEARVGPPLDAILHFASPASPPEYLRMPFDTIRAGSVGTWRLLDLARSRGARLLMASTSEIYGDPAVHPQREEYWGNVNPVGPRSVYDESKRFSEMLVAAYHRQYGTDVRIARIFNTYGPRMKPLDGRVIPNFISQALRGEPLTVYGGGQQTRSFCFYSDLVEGLVRLLAYPTHEPVNLGNPREFTILQLAEEVSRLVGRSVVVQHGELPQDDPVRRQPDIGRARSLLGWEPRVSLEEGLRETIDWFRQNLDRIDLS